MSIESTNATALALTQLALESAGYATGAGSSGRVIGPLPDAAAMVSRAFGAFYRQVAQGRPPFDKEALLANPANAESAADAAGRCPCCGLA